MPGLTVLRWFGGTKPPVHINKQYKGGKPSATCTAVSGFGDGPVAPTPADPPEERDVSSSGPLEKLHTAAWGLRHLVGSVAVPSLQLASRLLCRRWEPLQDQVQQHLASMEGIKDACKSLHVDSLQGLQDVLGSLLLSESVYKVLEMDGYKALMAVNNLKAHFPAHLLTLRRVQWAMPHAEHSYLLADSSDALFVAFMGTKRPRDVRCNVDVWQDQVLFKAAASADCEQQGEVPAAHRGFSSRAKSIPIEALYQQARSQGKRLVLCGHSLGGAVAQLCTIRLLQQLPPHALDTVSCIGFATPPVGNKALADMVKQNGWEGCFKNYLLPEDPIPRLLSSRRVATAPAASAGEEEPVAQATGSSPASALASVSLHTDSFDRATLFSNFRKVSLGSRASQSQQGEGQPSLETPRSSSHQGSHVTSTSGTSAAFSNVQPALEDCRATDGKNASRVANNIAPAEGLGILRGKHAEPASKATAQGNGWAVHVTGDGQQTAGVELQQGVLDCTASGSQKQASTHGQQGGLGYAGELALPSAAIASSPGSTVMDEEVAEQSRRRMQWMPRPPFRAMAQSARVAARFVTFPLAAAASVPMRVAPQFHEVGKTLYVHKDEISTSSPRPEQRRGGILPLTRSRSASAAEPLESAVLANSDARRAGSSMVFKVPSSPSLDSINGSIDENEVSEAEWSAAAESRIDPDLAPTQLPPRTFFPMHRMVSYRQRLLGICNESFKGRVWLPALPHFPNVPHPDDVTATMLLAPGLFPLKAEAVAPTPKHPQGPAEQQAAGATEVAALPGFARFVKPIGAASEPAAGAAPLEGALGSVDSHLLSEGPQKKRRRRGWGILHFFLRQRGDHRSAPVELEVRVEGKGLNTVTRAWVELGGLQPKPLGEGMNEGSMPAEITWKPASALPAAVHRNTLAAITPLGSFFSWLAVTLGWVRLLRRLQPADQNDYLVARVKVPAHIARQAQMAASNPLQAAVNDAHLPGVRVGPKLTMHLQSDFARTSIPLDIRVAADVDAQLAPFGWAKMFVKSWQEEPHIK